MSQIEKDARKLSPGREKALLQASGQPTKPPRYGAQPFMRLYQRGYIEWGDMGAGTFRATEKGRALLAIRHLLEGADNAE